MKQIVLDTETTGFYKHDRVIEIGAVEIINGRIEDRFHHYINPGIPIGADATRVHGISNAMLKDKPDFAAIAPELIDLLQDVQVIIHNAPFDVYYINFALALRSQREGIEYQPMEDMCNKVVDSLAIARDKFSGQQNSLDALIARFGIDASDREKRHGALIDARLLAQVYQAMCVTQSSFNLQSGLVDKTTAQVKEMKSIDKLGDFQRIQPTEAEKREHMAFMQRLRKNS